MLMFIRSILSSEYFMFAIPVAFLIFAVVIIAKIDKEQNEG